MKLELEGKRILVLGLGDTGLSVLRWLHGRGARLTAADTRDAPPALASVQAELPEVGIVLGPFRREIFDGMDLVVTSPGVPLAEPEVRSAMARGIPVVGDVELFAQYKPGHAKVLAVTGSNGKSTVTALTGEMCKAAGLHTIVAGNIGLPVLDTLQQDCPDVYVLELSSFQLETTASLDADAATVLNLTEDHMDRYADMAAYAAAKARIFHGHGVQVLNRNDAWSRSMALPGRHKVSFGLDAPPSHNDFGLIERNGHTWLAQGSTELINAADMRIAGRHNAANALAALALCRAIGLEYTPLLQALRDFKGLPHRVEWVAEKGGVAFYDDSKGTNVGATCAALNGLSQKVVLIAGGDGKGQDFSPLRQAVKTNARAVVLIGRDGPQIGRVLDGCGVPLLQSATLEDAVRQAYAVALPGDAVLLSPACASWDMFRNYAHRAQVFVDAVLALPEKGRT
ncbi:MAG: UDP-N-acetylmuramoyl-L-alanine--D-glutamate ligase [Methylophilaceae bacterium]|nr:UDP-N-acetylmuramoyl-L-alanine--D-glutamate ligase [Methylophilaceae bacterium]